MPEVLSTIVIVPVQFISRGTWTHDFPVLHPQYYSEITKSSRKTWNNTPLDMNQYSAV